MAEHTPGEVVGHQVTVRLNKAWADMTTAEQDALLDALTAQLYPGWTPAKKSPTNRPTKKS